MLLLAFDLSSNCPLGGTKQLGLHVFLFRNISCLHLSRYWAVRDPSSIGKAWQLDSQDASRDSQFPSSFVPCSGNATHMVMLWCLQLCGCCCAASISPWLEKSYFQRGQKKLQGPGAPCVTGEWAGGLELGSVSDNFCQYFQMGPDTRAS